MESDWSFLPLSGHPANTARGQVCVFNASCLSFWYGNTQIEFHSCLHFLPKNQCGFWLLSPHFILMYNGQFQWGRVDILALFPILVSRYVGVRSRVSLLMKYWLQPLFFVSSIAFVGIRRAPSSYCSENCLFLLVAYVPQGTEGSALWQPAVSFGENSKYLIFKYQIFPWLLGLPAEPVSLQCLSGSAAKLQPLRAPAGGNLGPAIV